MIYLTTYGGSVFYGPSDGIPNALEDIENMPFGDGGSTATIK